MGIAPKMKASLAVSQQRGVNSWRRPVRIRSGQALLTHSRPIASLTVYPPPSRLGVFVPARFGLSAGSMLMVKLRIQAGKLLISILTEVGNPTILQLCQPQE